MRVAEETTKARGVVRDQISAFAEHQMKSSLDVGFAKVKLQSRRSSCSPAREMIAAVPLLPLWRRLVSDEPECWEHLHLTTQPSRVHERSQADVSALIRKAFENRPDLLRLRTWKSRAAAKFRAGRNARLRNPP